MSNINNSMLTMEALVNYFSKNKIKSFDYSESGKPIVVKSMQEFSSSEIEESEDGKLYAKVRVCHTLLNRNGSFASEENMKKAMPTLKYSPLLAKIHQLDSGEWDFHKHDFHIDENGETIYDESQIGTFTADDPYFEYDEEMDKTYVVAKVAIPTEYTRAAQIIKEKGGTKVSCELAIYSCSYNAKEKYLELEDFIFMGCTCLGREKDGTEIGEGMLGSKLTLEDFSANDNVLNKIAELQERLSKVESACFSINDTLGKEEQIKVDTEKNFEEVAETEEVETEEVTETEETTEEEVTDTEDSSEETVDETPAESEEVVEEATEETESYEEVEDVDTVTQYSEIKGFQLSHSDIRYALYNLLYSYEEADNEWYEINSVFDDYFIYQNWFGDKIYGQKYVKDGDNVSFDGERYTLHAEFLTDSEYAELQSMRSNYAALVEFKEAVEKNELHAKREAILSNEKYSSISETDAFKKLYSEMDNYSIEDLEKEAKIIFADNIDVAQFSATEKKNDIKVFANVNKAKKDSRYGNLFSK